MWEEGLVWGCMSVVVFFSPLVLFHASWLCVPYSPVTVLKQLPKTSEEVLALH